MAEAKNEAVERAKKQMEEDKKIREKSAAEYAEHARGKPTPTQEENDLAMYGGHVTGEKHEDDGSAPDPHAASTKHTEASKPAASYQTRNTAAKHE